MTDANDNKPIFQPDPTFFPQAYTIAVPENAPINAPVIKLNATDKDDGSNAALTYAIVKDDDGYFQVDATKGLVTLRKQLDREAKGLAYTSEGFGIVSFEASVTDNGDTTLSAVVQVRLPNVIFIIACPYNLAH